MNVHHCLVRGDVASRSFSVIALRGDLVVALDCVNATRDYVQGRALVEQRCRVTDAAQEAALLDATLPLKSLVTEGHDPSVSRVSVAEP
jgi:3-phenylpropionate/trans-cinnamate dioxygenase ferredoxin reductase subunit